MSFSTELISFHNLVDVLLEVERRQSHARADLDQLLHAHLVENAAAPLVVPSERGRSLAGRGHGFRLRVQCHSYGRFGHLAQWCYYRFNREYVDAVFGVRVPSFGSGDVSGAPSSGAPPVLGSHEPLAFQSN